MPHSPHWSISTMIEHAVRVGPLSVMDIGYGYGKWGFLIREALDFVGDRHTREEWTVQIDGIDAFPQESPLLDWVYDRVQVGDVLQVITSIRDYDLVILGDVIEHFEKQDGRRLITALVAHNRCVLVTTPREFFAQGEIGGNPFERHRSHWTARDFANWPGDVDVRGGSLTVAIRGVGGRYPSDAAIRASRIVRRIPGIRHRGAASTALKEALARYVVGL